MAGGGSMEGWSFNVNENTPNADATMASVTIGPVQAQEAFLCLLILHLSLLSFVYHIMTLVSHLTNFGELL